MSYKLNFLDDLRWITLILENHFQGSVKMITPRYKRFSLVWQVISANYYTPQYLLNKSRSRRDWHTTEEIRFSGSQAYSQQLY